MSDVLKVEPRDKTGTLNNRRLRAQGQIPAVLYGHGEGSVSLSFAKDELRTVLRHGGKLVELQGAASGNALLQDLQWDAFGRELLHVDLLRVHKGDKLHVDIPVELKGQAPGEADGGVVELMLHEVPLEVVPSKLPEKLHIDVSELNIGDSFGAEKLIDVPEGAKVLLNEDDMIVHCVRPAEEPEEDEAVAPSAGEPELVGKKDDEEEGDQPASDS